MNEIMLIAYRHFCTLCPVVFRSQSETPQGEEAGERRDDFEEGVAVGHLGVGEVVEGQVGGRPLEAGHHHVGGEAVGLLLQPVHDVGPPGLGVGAVHHQEKRQAQTQLKTV